MKKHSVLLAAVILTIFSFSACDAGNSDSASTAVSGVTLDKTALTVEVEENQLLKFTIIPSTAANKKVTWKSNNADVATVSTSGRVTGVKAGSAIITVTTEDGNKTAVCNVTVEQPIIPDILPTGITLSPQTLELDLAGPLSGTLAATISPPGADNAVEWSSSHPAVATVDGGIVTAVGEGTATISARAVRAAGNVSAICTVTVTETADPQITPIAADFNIHFLELGNKYTGDCVYINYGDMDILIDAGLRETSAPTIKAFIDGHIKDDKLEYVIVTHGHQDHIAGFVSTSTTTGMFDAYEIGTIIDFPKTDSISQIYNRYVAARTGAINRGAVHYTALQCYNNEGGAQRIYDLGGDVKLEILYNYYYENSGSENDYSVCIRIVHGENQYLFTGDLESAGEGRLVDHYAAQGGLGHSVLWKGGHHGSQTSASQKLMAAVSPEYIVICTCTGTPEYGANPQNVFPAQSFINRIAPHTDKVYATTLITDYANNKYEPLNGNVTFSVADDGVVTVTGSSNNLKLKETEWFLNNRTMPDAWK